MKKYILTSILLLIFSNMCAAAKALTCPASSSCISNCNTYCQNAAELVGPGVSAKGDGTYDSNILQCSCICTYDFNETTQYSSHSVSIECNE